MRVSAASQEKDFTFDVTRKNAAQMGWTTERWTFTANSALTKLEFRSHTPVETSGWGAAIDNVSVTEAPGPAAPQ